nr:NADH dehydrogenase subunit 2 [Percnon planissimum]
MTIPFSYFLFLFTLLLGSFIAISSPSWFSAWVGLELNLMSFIPLITSSKSSISYEAALKYFLMQALGSALFITASFLSISMLFTSLLLILLALLLKLGAAPFHFWLPQVMEGLKWSQIFILSTIQKLAPMILLSYMMNSLFLSKLLILFSILSSMVGALGGLNLMSLRKIIAFSSINHMSWMFIAILISDTMWFMYFLLYSIILFSIISMFKAMYADNIVNLVKPGQANILFNVMISFNILSLSGLPPFTGFIPKWFLIQMMANNNLFLPLFFLLFSSLITLYYYLRMVIPFILLQAPFMNHTMKYKFNLNHSLTFKTSFNLLGLILPVYSLAF